MEKQKYRRCSREDFKKTYIYEIIINPFKLSNLLFNKYGDIEEDLNLMLLEAILYSKNCHLGAKYRDYLIWDYVDEFLKRFYNCKESKERLPRIANYYKNYLKFFCSPLFKDFAINDMIQSYGHDKAKIYYKNNYGSQGFDGLHGKKANNVNDKEEINNKDNNNNANKTNDKIKEGENGEAENKSLIFNTSVRCTIENNVITRSSFNTKNDASKNYDSFFETSLSKINNNLESKKNFLNFSNIKSTEEDPNSILIGKNFNKNFILHENKNTQLNKKENQESLVNLLDDVNANSSFTYYLMTEFDISKNNRAKKDNKNCVKSRSKFAKKDELGVANKAKVTAARNNKHCYLNYNFINENKSENIKKSIQPGSASKISFCINNKQKNNYANAFQVSPDPSKKHKPTANNKLLINTINNPNLLLIRDINSNKPTEFNKSPKISKIVNTRNSPNSKPNEHKNELNFKNKINEQSQIFKNMYNDFVKRSTKKLLEAQSMNKNYSKLNAQKNFNIESKKGSSMEKQAQPSTAAGPANDNKDKDSQKQMIEIDLIKKSNEIKSRAQKTECKRSSSSNSNKASKALRRPISVLSNQYKDKNILNILNEFKELADRNCNNKANAELNNKKLFSMENPTSNDINVEANNNLVINITSGLKMSLDHLQGNQNFSNKISISPERILLDISKNLGSPILNSIVNINIKPILQVNNNESNVNIFNADGGLKVSNRIPKETNHEKKIENQNHIKAKNEKATGNKTDLITKLLLNPASDTRFNDNAKELKTRFSEFKSIKLLSENKPGGRFSSMSNTSNKSKEIPKKFSYNKSQINNLECQLDTGKMNLSLNKQLMILSSKKVEDIVNNNTNNNKSASKTGRIIKLSKSSKLNIDKLNKIITKSFDQKVSQVKGLDFHLKRNKNFPGNKALNSNNCNDYNSNKINFNSRVNSKESVKGNKNVNDSSASKSEFLMSDCGKRSNFEMNCDDHKHNYNKDLQLTSNKNYATEIKKLCSAKSIRSSKTNQETKKKTPLGKSNNNQTNKNKYNNVSDCKKHLLNENFINFVNNISNKLFERQTNQKEFTKKPQAAAASDKHGAEGSHTQEKNENKKNNKIEHCKNRDCAELQKRKVFSSLAKSNLKLKNPFAPEEINRFSTEFSSSNNVNSTKSKIGNEKAGAMKFSTLNNKKFNIANTINNYLLENSSKNCNKNNFGCQKKQISNCTCDLTSPFSCNVDFKELIESNCNKAPFKKSKLDENSNRHISNSKLNAFLLNSNNLLGLNSPHNSTNLLSNNSSVNIINSTLNPQTNNDCSFNLNARCSSSKCSNYVNNKKTKHPLKNVDSFKTRNSFAYQGHLKNLNYFDISKDQNNRNQSNILSLKTSNFKSRSKEKSEDSSKKKLENFSNKICKENKITIVQTASNKFKKGFVALNHNNNIKHGDYRTHPVISQKANFPFPSTNQFARQSRNKHNLIYRLSPNPCENSKQTESNLITAHSNLTCANAQSTQLNRNKNKPKLSNICLQSFEGNQNKSLSKGKKKQK